MRDAEASCEAVDRHGDRARVRGRPDSRDLGLVGAADTGTRLATAVATLSCSVPRASRPLHAPVPARLEPHRERPLVPFRTRPRHRRRRLRRREPRLALRRRRPGRRGRRARQPQAARLRAQPPAAAARRASSSSTATCASPATCSRSARSTRSSSAPPSRRCWPASAAAPDYVVQTNLRRRLPLPRARAPRRRPVHLPLDEPRLPGRAALNRLALRERRDPLRARAAPAAPRRLRARDRGGLPARRRAHAVRRDEARGRAARRGVRRRVRRCPRWSTAAA